MKLYSSKNKAVIKNRYGKTVVKRLEIGGGILFRVYRNSVPNRPLLERTSRLPWLSHPCARQLKSIAKSIARQWCTDETDVYVCDYRPIEGENADVVSTGYVLRSSWAPKLEDQIKDGIEYKYTLLK